MVGLVAILGIERPSGNVPVFGAWTELGPKPFFGFKLGLDGQTIAGYEAQSGQPSSIAVDLTHDPSGNTVYVCSAGGGLWKSTNGLGLFPVFHSISDPELPSSCGAVALDTSTTPTTIYVGTGDPDNPSNVAAYAGDGILISRDDGQTWSQVTSAENGARPFKGLGFSKIIVAPDNPAVLLAATGVGLDFNYAHSAYPQGNGAFNHLGIYRSADAGNTWSRVKTAPAQGFNPGGLFHIDLIHEPVRDVYIAGISRQGLWASRNGLSWQLPGQLGLPTGGLPAASELQRISLATRDGHLWALVLVNGPDGPVHRLFMLHRNGKAWKEIPKPAELGWKGFLGYVAAPPNSNALVVAAECLFHTDNINAVIPVWRKVDFRATASLHGDQHAIAFVDSDTWYVGDDGGAFVTLDGGNDWKSLNATLKTTEFYSATPDSDDSGLFVGGQQDNGPSVSVDGFGWKQVLRGDGMYTHADPYDPRGFFISTQVGNISYLSLAQPFPLLDRVVNFNDATDANVSGGRGAFLTPFELLPRDPRLFEGTAAAFFFDFSRARIILTGNKNPWLVGFIPGAAPIAVRLLNGFKAINKQYIQYIAPDPQDPTSAYLVTGAADPALYRLTNIDFNGNASAVEIDVPSSNSWSTNVLGHIAASPVCSEGLYVAKVGFQQGHKILKTTTGGQSWINISGNLPNVPVHWITLDRANPNVIYVGTNVGAFVATDGGVEGEQWRRLGTDLPNVPVMQLKISRTRKLIASTFGRGVWSLDLPPLLPYIQRPPSIANVDVQPPTLWPPDGRMVDVSINYSATDDCGTPACTLSVTSSDPADGLPADYAIVDANHVRLRAQLGARGAARTYTVTITCTGGDGLATTASRTISVSSQ
jgi:photosystem II stability/assembly factor-like uncharacterized protein